MGRFFIKVILPLKLDWEPWYYTDAADVACGSRVRLRFAGKEYVAVVSMTGGVPDIGADRVLPIIGVETELETISPAEMRLWRFLADYYMCTVGEVYKNAYPATRVAMEEKKARKTIAEIPESAQKRPPMSPVQKDAAKAVLDAFAAGRPVLLEGGDGRREVVCELVRRTLDSGRDVLVLEPGRNSVLAACKWLQRRFGESLLCLNNPDTYAHRREIARAVRSGGTPRVVLGGKAAVFLPWSHLGLVVVDEEQSRGFKQDSPAPCFNGRDTAIFLAGIHRADVLLTSCCPSLESAGNCLAGKFSLVRMPVALCSDVEFIDTAAEARKKGMAGEWSFKLLKMLREVEAAKGKALIVSPWELEEPESLPSFARLVKPSALDAANAGRYALVAFLHADAMCARQDFRSDEKLLQTLVRLRASFGGHIAVQTSGRTSLPQAAALLEERRAFGLPPFSRIVDVCLKDTSDKRLAYMASLLADALKADFAIQGMMPVKGGCIIRVGFEKGAGLDVRKRLLASTVASFEKERKYTGHIVFDVDPL